MIRSIKALEILTLVLIDIGGASSLLEFIVKGSPFENASTPVQCSNPCASHANEGIRKKADKHISKHKEKMKEYRLIECLALRRRNEVEGGRQAVLERAVQLPPLV